MKVGLFIPCYINAVYPGEGRASYELLGRLGCEGEYPLGATCRGQPGANAGFEEDGRPRVPPLAVPPLAYQSLPYLKRPSANKMCNAELTDQGEGGGRVEEAKTPVTTTNKK